MRTTFRKSFLRDLKKIKDESLLERIQKVIERVEATDKIQQISDLKKISGTSGFYRIRVEGFRIGIAVEENTVEFVRCLNRRDIYKYFP